MSDLIWLHEDCLSNKMQIFKEAKSSSSKTLFTANTPNLDLQKIIQEVGKNLSVKIISPQPFVNLESQPNLRRFFNYWK